MQKKYKDLKKLKNANSICLIAHIDPDVDALSSLVLMKDFIKEKFNKHADIFAECETLQDSYLPILDDAILNPEIREYDAAIIIDCPNVERLGKYAELYKKAKIKGVIDHHATNNLNPEIKFVEIVSSTCEILYSIFNEYNYKLNKKISSRLYSGLITDTNNFSVGAMTKTSFELASACIKYINPHDYYNYFFLNSTLKSKRAFALSIDNSKTYEGGRIIISHISKSEADNLEFDQDDYTSISNQLAGTQGCELMCFIYPKSDSYYVSMRAREPYDVAQIAKKHGGGGHVGAAAYLSSANTKTIESAILKEFKLELNSKKEGERKSIF